MKSILGIVKINLRQSKLVYLIFGIIFIAGLANSIVGLAVKDSGAMPLGNYIFLLPILLAIFIPLLHFTKLMNLGGKRLDFFKSCILTYLPVIFIICAASLVLHYTLDSITEKDVEVVLGLWKVFKFIDNNPVVAFIQMFSILFLLCCTLHTLSLIQSRWYGWVIDALIIAIISVFTPIPVLRSSLVWFFNLIIFNDLAIIQILSCLALGSVIYFASIIPIKNKKI